MKRLYLLMLLGAMTVISCAMVVPEVPEEEQNQPDVASQGFRLTGHISSRAEPGTQAVTSAAASIRMLPATLPRALPM